MSRTEEEITRETEGTEEPCGVIVDEIDNILHMANEINQILVFHTGRFTNNLASAQAAARERFFVRQGDRTGRLSESGNWR